MNKIGMTAELSDNLMIKARKVKEKEKVVFTPKTLFQPRQILIAFTLPHNKKSVFIIHIAVFYNNLLQV